MKITVELKKRFCKDFDLPIKLYEEPYFMDRIKLFDKNFNCIEKWNTFVSDIARFGSEQEYFEYYNQVKDKFIDTLKSKASYQEFITCDFNRFKIPNYGVGRKSVFKEDNIGKRLISVDLRKGNYNALKFFNPDLVNNTKSYDELISSYTDLKHIIQSKYIRQVVFGACNPERQVTVEKYMMNFVMEILLKYMSLDKVQTYMGDEIVFEYFDGLSLTELYQDLEELQCEKGFELHYDDYSLAKIPNTEFYVKYSSDGKHEFKCTNPLIFPFVIRAYNGEEVQESDLVFYNEGYLCKFIDVPKIEVV